MTTQMTYNGVLLKDVLIKRFSENCRYDESNTDLLFHQFVIRVEALVHTNQAGAHAVVLPQVEASMGAQLGTIQSALMHPRGTFELKFGNDVVLTANNNPNSQNVDVNNGPKPLACDVTHVAGTKVARVEFEIEVSIVKCDLGEKDEPYDGSGQSEGRRGAGRGQFVLNNRWSLEDTRDENFWVTRTWSGVLRISTSFRNPQFYRNLVVPPLQRGFKRMGQHFVSSADGLHLRYSITDRAIHAAPPFPATSWKAQFTSSTGIGGAVTHAECTVSMEGPAEADKRGLLTAAVQVVEARLGDLRKSWGQRGTDNDAATVINGATITEHLDRNAIDLNIRVLVVNAAASGQAAGWMNTYLKEYIGKPLQEGAQPIPGYHSQDTSHLVPGLFDTNSPAGVFIQYLQTPCDDIHGMPQPAPLTVTVTDGNYDDDKEDPDPEDPGTLADKLDNPDGYNAKHIGNPYTYVEISNHYNTSAGRVALPIANGLGTDSHEFVLLHRPCTYRVYHLKAERVGDWPELPPPDDFITTGPDNIDEGLISKELITTTPELMPDGRQYMYRLEARYRYAMRREPQTQLRAGKSPVDERSAEDNLFNQGSYYTDEEDQ